MDVSSVTSEAFIRRGCCRHAIKALLHWGGDVEVEVEVDVDVYSENSAISNTAVVKFTPKL